MDGTGATQPRSPTWFHTNSTGPRTVRPHETLNFGVRPLPGRRGDAGKRCANQVVTTAQMLHADGPWRAGKGWARIHRDEARGEGCEQPQQGHLLTSSTAPHGVRAPVLLRGGANAIALGDLRREIVFLPSPGPGDLFVINPKKGEPPGREGAIELHDPPISTAAYETDTREQLRDYRR